MAAREAVDAKRADGEKIGLLKIRALRPFPKDAVIAALKGKKSFGVIDRNVSFGWNTGVVYQEVKSALYEGGCNIPAVPFISGLGGEDITVDMLCQAIDQITAATENKSAVWLTRE